MVCKRSKAPIFGIVAFSVLLGTAALLPAQEGWQNGGNYPAIGDPGAKREVLDKPMTIVLRSFVPTLRRQGPNSRPATIATIHGLVYQPLIDIHPNTEEFHPKLAKEWKIETDAEGGRQTFWFRLDPRARFSDGSKVTAKDVYWTWWHRIQEDRKDHSSRVTFFEGYEEPVIVDEMTIKVTTKKQNWRLFLYFGAAMLIYPAKYIHIPGKQYLEEYNWKLMPGSGPYIMKEGDLKKGESITLSRRHDWWAENERWAKNTFNFETIKFKVIRDTELEYERFRAGELDLFRITRSQRWVQEVPKEKIVKKGWVQRRKIFNQSPQGFSGLCMNMRTKPFNDPRVREAFCHLFNVELLNKKLFFNEYVIIDSYYPGRDWGNPDNPKIRFDPDRAEELLYEAGYKERNDDGWLVDEDGKQFELTLEFAPAAWERIWLVVKKDIEEAGIKFNLKSIDRTTLIKKIGDRKFRITHQAWTGLLFPNPETSWRSDFADKKQTNNLPGFKSDKVDALLEEYNVEMDRAEQKKIIRQVDALIFKEHPFALGWYANFERILYWDKFGFPPSMFSKIGDIWMEEVVQLWWFDPQKEQELQAAMKAGKSIPQGEIEVRFWDKAK